MSLQYFCITQQGENHIQNNTPCQDASSGQMLHLDRLGHDVILVAVADGVGSCTYSQFGANIAVSSVLRYLSDNLVTLNVIDDRSVVAVLKSAFQFALDQVENDADANERPFVEMDATLTVAIYLDDGTLWCGHIGDGGIVVLYDDATYEMITTRHKGEEFNSVYPLRNKLMWSFGKAKKRVASLVVMTDGVLDITVTSERYNERVYFPMLGTAMANPLSNSEDVSGCRKTMEDFLASCAFRKRVKDDITFAVIQNSDMVAALPEVQFDKTAWIEEQNRIKKDIDDRLKLAAEQTFENRELMQKRSYQVGGKETYPKVDLLSASKRDIEHRRKQVDEDSIAPLESVSEAYQPDVEDTSVVKGDLRINNSDEASHVAKDQNNNDTLDLN